MTPDAKDPGVTTPRHSNPAVETAAGVDPLLEQLRAATLGEYDVAAELGRGGMAAVYLAHEIALDRPVAIKVMLPELLSGPGMVERFRREARTAGSLSHPHIIPIHAVKESEGLLFFVMKFVEGRALDSIIRELGPLPLPMVQTILSQVAGALAYAHRKNVIHRDIKPANVMIDEDGWAVVADFGIAKVQDAAALTTTGAAIGTPFYMSPEQASGKPVSGASDQYSLGIMAYEMLTGRTPFSGTMMEVMSGHFFELPVPIVQSRSDCPETLGAAVLCMLAKNPADRFPSLDAVIAAIAAPQLAHDDPVRTQMITLARSGRSLRPRMSVPMSPVPSARARKSRSAAFAPAPEPISFQQRLRRRSSLLALAVLLTVAGLGGAWWYRGSSAPPPNVVPSRAPDSARIVAPSPTDSSAIVAAPVAPAPARHVAPPPPLPAHDRGRADHDARVRRDSITTAGRHRADSLSRAREDSIGRARADSIIKVRSDSLTRVQHLAAAAESARVAALPDSATVVVGTRTRGAGLYVNDSVRNVLNGLKPVRLRAGTVRLSIKADGCTAWDTTLNLRAGDRLMLGYRTPRCP
jgi:serine/threonine protein kinase